MKQCILLLLAFVCVHGAPAGVLQPSSCKDTTTTLVAREAINKINQYRTTGYVFHLERVSNVYQTSHGETGVVFYLTIDILETKCHVLSKKSYKDCEIRDIHENPVYGQCKTVIYVNKPHRVSRLYKYSCILRPVSASRIIASCPDCPILISLDNEQVEKTMKMGLEKFNKESTLSNYFAPLNITRAISQGGLITMYNVEFTIQETMCSKKNDISDTSTCDLMNCEFAHKGFCTATHTRSVEEFINYHCEIYEPQAAEEEKENHLHAGMVDHHHENIGGTSFSHDHTHDHTLAHFHPTTLGHDHNHDHSKAQGHHHTHEHDEGHIDKAHAYAHSHEHSHDHDHVHEHHSQAHNHAQDQGVHLAHHNYGHAEEETHEHDHELALDHEHKHGHLHEHEHHHHHHQHQHETTVRKPEGIVEVLPSMDKSITLPFFPDQHDKLNMPTSLPLSPDPEIPGQMEPVIGKFPEIVSSICPAEFNTNKKLIHDALAEDPAFNIKLAA